MRIQNLAADLAPCIKLVHTFLFNFQFAKRCSTQLRPTPLLDLTSSKAMGFKRRQINFATTGLFDSAQNQGHTNSRLEYVGELGGNDAPPTYQEPGGAPIESNSPFGYTVGPVTILFLNISMMIGTGIYSTRELSTIGNRACANVLTELKRRLS